MKDKLYLCEMIPINNFPGYFICEDGSVYSNKRGKLKKLNYKYTQDGYAFVGLYNEFGRFSKRINRLVAEHYIGLPLSQEFEVNHEDTNKLNNHYSNLKWMTHKENMDHASQNNLLYERSGSRNPNCKITQEIADSIRSSDLSVNELSKLYNVGKTTIRDI